MAPVERIGGIEGLSGTGNLAGAGKKAAVDFTDALRDAVASVDRLQKESEAAQVAHAKGEPVDLHDVLIKIEEAEIAFKMMMEVRNKLVDAYREVMRMGV